MHSLFGIVSLIASTLAPSASAVSGDTQTLVPQAAPTYAAVDGDPVDLHTGLYVRRTIDLVLMDSGPIVFARVYRNRDSQSRPFGIGTNHSFGSFLVGDARITYIDLILPDGGRVHYRRTSGGTGVVGAVFQHTTTPSEYRNSRLSWNGAGWTIELRDGSRYTYPACPPSLNKPCTVASYRDRYGHEIRMQHDRRMNLIQVKSQRGATIDLTYDSQDRIVLVRSGHGQQVRYEYDVQGRLVRVADADGVTASYKYDNDHQMVGIVERGISIKNAFDSAGRCISNDVRTETVDKRGKKAIQRLLYRFAYTLDAAGRVTATEVKQGASHRKVTFNEQGYSLSETRQAGGSKESGAALERDDISNVVQRLTLWCGAERRWKVEIPVNPDSPIETLTEIARNACARAAKDR
jgi:YD repeat-containing protein